MSDDRLASPYRREDEARLLHAAGRERLLMAAADLGIPERLRLSDWQRTIVAGLNAKMVRTVEDELRTSLAEDPAIRASEALAAALGSAHVAIAAPILDRCARPLDRPFVSALVQRAEEHRRSRARSGELPLLIELVRDEDALVAEHAMAILIAQSRRFDSFSEPAAARTELPAELEHRLVWRVAAALRHYIVEVHGFDPVLADDLIVAAADRLLASYDEGDALEARAARLARRLREQGRLTDAFMETALVEGSFALFVAGLGARTSLSHSSAWEILFDPKGRGAVYLLKAAGVERSHAGSILLHLASSEDEVPARLDLFDVTETEEAHAALRLWQVDPAYREAIAELAA